MDARRHYHRPLSREDEASILIFNQRFSQLDRAIHNLSNQIASPITAEAGESISDLDPIFLDPSDNLIYRMDNDDSDKVGAIRGFADGGASMGADVTMVFTGILDGFSSLTPGAAVYVGSTAGTISQTRPAAILGGSQVSIIEMGVAVSATQIFVRPKPVQFEKRNLLADEDTLTLMHYSDELGYKRRIWAYITETFTGSSIESYASGNQDSNVAMAGTSYAGSVLDTGTQTGSTTVLGDAGNTEYQQAQSFQLSAGGQLSQFTFVLVANAGSPVGDLNWDIRADNAGNPTGAVLATGSIANGSVVPSATNTVNISNGPILQAGTSYWLKLYPASAQSVGVRWQLPLSTTGSYANGLLKFSTNGGGSWDSGGGTNDIGITITVVALNPYDKLAQTFTLSGTETIAEVGLWLKKVGSPTGTGTLRIETTSGGNPTGTLAHANASATFNEADLITSYGEVLVTFASSFSLGAGTYAIVLSTSRSASGTDYIEWGADGSSPGYAGGEMKGYVSAAWGNLSKDAIFDVREASIFHPQRIKVDRWSSAFADMVNQYGDAAGEDADTMTTFKCVAAGGFDDVTVVVRLE